MSDPVTVINAVRDVILVVAGALFAGAALAGLFRVSKGPSTLDRAVGSDLLLGVLIAGLAIEAEVNHHANSLPLMLVLTLVGFAGPVAIARYIPDAARNDAADPTTPSHGPSTKEDRHG